MLVKVAPVGSIVIIGLFRRRYFKVEDYGLREIPINEIPKED